MMEQDRVALCAPKGKRLPERAAVRAGSLPSEVPPGSQRIAMRRLRARGADGETRPAELRVCSRSRPARPPNVARSGAASRRAATATSSTRCLRQMSGGRSRRAAALECFVALSTERLREPAEHPIGDLGSRPCESTASCCGSRASPCRARFGSRRSISPLHRVRAADRRRSGPARRRRCPHAARPSM